MQCQLLKLIWPADPDRLVVADRSAGWRRMLRPWLGSEEECCDRLAMPALGLGPGEMQYACHVFAVLAQVAWENAHVRQEGQSQAKLMGTRSFRWEEVPRKCSEAKTGGEGVSMGIV